MANPITMQDLEGLLDRLITVATRSGGSSRDSGSLNALQVAVKLDGPTTYLQWKRSTRLLVQGRGLEGYLTGTKKKPANNEQDMAQWRMENSVVLAFLLNTLTPNVARSVQLLKTAQEVWETVAQMFSQKQNSAQAFEIRSQLRQLRQGDLSITEYATELKRLWSEADHYRNFAPQCSIDVDGFQKYLEEERVQDFLYGLNPEYESVRVQLLARDILPSLGQVFSTVLSEETWRRVTSDSNSSIRSALTVQPQQVGEKVCFHCKKPGHTKAFCWDLHDRPNQPGRGSRGRGGRLSGGRTGGQNHVRGPAQANLSEETEGAIHSLSTKEYQTFRRMMEKYESSSNTTPSTLEQSSHQDEYLDSSLFAHSGHDKVRIADGSFTPVSGKGSIDCTPNLRLSSEQRMGKILGGGRMHNGLYYLSTDEKSMSSSLMGYALSAEGTQFGVKIKILRSDNGTEYINQEFRAYLQTHGILHQTTCVDTPAQNGVAERKNRHLLEVARSLLFTMQVPKFLWGEAVLTAAYLINRMPLRTLGFKSPIQCLKGSTDYVVTPRVFGCVCFARDYRPSVGKLDPRALKCVFVGYPATQKEYKCYYPPERRMLVTMDVTFRETEAYYGSRLSDNKTPELFLPGDFLYTPNSGAQGEYHTSSPESPNGNNISTTSSISNLNISIAKRKGTRSIVPPARYRYDITNYVSYKNVSPSYQSFIAALDSVCIPSTWQKAMAEPKWKEAMLEEMTALSKNQTWDLVTLPAGKHPVGCK
ncbi:uncharacterized protein [Elaeis guineensis]|uniref:uncharacterized protein n=1 Tax=Elaeis guineensis var. tenera TaxID=51953 RepID=UPI003C6D28D4